MDSSPHQQVTIVPTLDELGVRAAEVIVNEGRRAIAEQGKFMVALSGGRTPRIVFGHLSSKKLHAELDWSKCHLFWVDERCVGLTHPESNYGMAEQNLLRFVPEARVYRMRAEAENAGTAAEEYESMMRRVFGLGSGEVPRFNLLLLGVGEDGHVASLFPGSPALEERHRLVVPTYAEKLRSRRLTMTFPVLNNAFYTLFVAFGEAKHGIVQSCLLDDSGSRYPAQLVRPRDGTIHWITDAALNQTLAS